jgi:hypothetical protein
MKKANNPKLEGILNEAGLPYFNMAVTHLFDVGYRNMTEESVRETIKELNAKEENPRAFMTNDFMVFIIETAYKISQAASILDLVKFTSKHIN